MVATRLLLCSLIAFSVFSVDSCGAMTAASSSGISNSSGSAISPQSSSSASSSAPSATPEGWLINSPSYSLTSGIVTLTINTNIGARITSFQAGNSELLFYNGSLNSGSTFWPSPQNSWPWSGHWPSPTNFDLLPYSASFSNSSNALVLESSPQAALGLSVRKILTRNAASNEITIAYGLKNETATNVQWAPWEITRVPKSAIVFFPKESSNYTGTSTYTPALETPTNLWCQNGASWQKLFRDGGEGWIGVSFNGRVFVKKFGNISVGQFAAGESDVEIYGGGNYFEVENQGAFVTIAPGEWLSWSVTWRAAVLPADVTNAVGSLSLYQFARQLAQ